MCSITESTLFCSPHKKSTENTTSAHMKSSRANKIHHFTTLPNLVASSTDYKTDDTANHFLRVIYYTAWIISNGIKTIDLGPVACRLKFPLKVKLIRKLFLKLCSN